MPRKKVLKQLRSVPHPISLFPRHIRHVKARSKRAKISQSRYLQALVEYDLRHNILANALTAGIDAEVAS